MLNRVCQNYSALFGLLRKYKRELKLNLGSEWEPSGPTWCVGVPWASIRSTECQAGITQSHKIVWGWIKADTNCSPLRPLWAVPTPGSLRVDLLEKEEGAALCRWVEIHGCTTCKPLDDLLFGWPSKAQTVCSVVSFMGIFKSKRFRYLSDSANRVLWHWSDLGLPLCADTVGWFNALSSWWGHVSEELPRWLQ